MSYRPNHRRASLVLSGLLALAVPVAADTLKVPQDFATIQEAIDAAAPGDTVSISAGEYLENLVVPAAKDGLVLSGKGAVFVDALGEGSGIAIGSSQVTVRNITVRHAAEAGVEALAETEGTALTGVALEGVTVINAGAGAFLAVDGARLDKCDFLGCSEFGVLVIGDGAQVSNVSVENSSGGGISVIEGNGAQIERCSLEDIDGIGIQVVGNAAIVERNELSNVNGPLIEVTGDNAEISRNEGSAGAEEGIVATGNGITVDKNRLSACAGDLVRVEGTTASITSNKLADGGVATEGDGIEVAGDDAVISKNQVAAVLGVGVHVNGNEATVDKNRVDGALVAGFAIVGDGSSVTQNSASDCGNPAAGLKNGVQGNGFDVLGNENTLDRNTARESVYNGIRVWGSDNVLTNNKSLDNAVNGILVESDAIEPPEGDPIISLSNVLEGNVCTGNHGQGLLNEGVGTLIEQNRFTKNRLDLTNTTSEGATLVDQGGNVFDTGGLETEPEVTVD